MRPQGAEFTVREIRAIEAAWLRRENQKRKRSETPQDFFASLMKKLKLEAADAKRRVWGANALAEVLQYLDSRRPTFSASLARVQDGFAPKWTLVPMTDEEVSELIRTTSGQPGAFMEELEQL